MALALYRKYRPATFAEVVGQEHVTEPLSRAIEAGRINHAYLFSGPRGCGKTSSARILARSLNCELGPTPEPCGVCPSCVSLAPGGPGNIDVTELDAASHGGVDDTRELRDRAFFAPAESRYRVFIVDEAHMISTQGFNALLKIVEEPPDHLVFVFATTEPEKVLPTIRSRTHHYPFRLIPPGVLRSLLERVCAEEGVVVAPAVYPLVIRAGGGSARDSLSVLDQLVSGAGPDGVTYERAVALLGVSDLALIDGVVDGLAAGDRAAVFETVDRLVEAGHDPRRFAADLLQRLRDLTLVQAVPDAVDRGLVDAAADEVARMAGQAGRLGPATLTRYGEIVHAGLVEMRGATAPRLVLELLCARMLLPAAVPAEAGLLERLERLERLAAIVPDTDGGTAAGGQQEPASRSYGRASTRAARPAGARSDDRSTAAVEGGPPAPAGPIGSGPVADAVRADEARPGGASAPAASSPASAVEHGGETGPPPAGPPPVGSPPAEPPPAEPQTAEPPPGGPPLLDAAAVRQVWPEILTQAKERKKRTAALLVSATVRAVEDNTLVLSIGTAPLARMLSEQSNLDVIADALHAVLGVRWRVRCAHGDPQGDLATTATRGSVARAAAVGSGAAGAAPGPVAARENAPPQDTVGRAGAAAPGPRDRGGAAADDADAPGPHLRPRADDGASLPGATSPAHAATSPSPDPPRPDPPRPAAGGPAPVEPIRTRPAPARPAGSGEAETDAGGSAATVGSRASPRRAKTIPRRRSSAPDDGLPLPPEPTDEDVAPPEEEDEMIAEAAVAPADRPPVPEVAQDNGPERAALALLTTQLGARTIDRR